MKTLDEVIKACEETVSDVDRGVDIEGCFLGATETRDALHYLRAFRDAKDTLEREKYRYQEAVKNCEEAENKYRTLKGELEGFPSTTRMNIRW